MTNAITEELMNGGFVSRRILVLSKLSSVLPALDVILRRGRAFVAEQLETVYQGLLHAKQARSRLFALRFDLCFPNSKELKLIPHLYTNASICDFWKRLKSKIAVGQLRAARSGVRVHDTEVHYIWAREYGAQSETPHFH